MMGATLIIACGALAREIDALKRANGWDRLQVQCLDASLHNRPKAIPARVDALLEKHFHQYERVCKLSRCASLSFTPCKPSSRRSSSHKPSVCRASSLQVASDLLTSGEPLSGELLSCEMARQ